MDRIDPKLLAPMLLNPSIAKQGDKARMRAQALGGVKGWAGPDVGGFLSDPQSYKDMARNALGMVGSPLPAGAGPMMSRRYPELKSDPEYMDKMMGLGLAGLTVYHGSPHKFDKFDMSKVGTGEGAQAYGHGLYLAENPEVAKGYANKLSAWSDGSGNAVGNTYKVDLPDEHIAKMLDWDTPLSQQAPEVQAAVAKMHGVTVDQYKQMMKLDPDKFDKTGKEMLAHRFERGDSHTRELISEDLKKAGIPGIKYLDQGSRTTGQGTKNFVVFDDQLPKIVGRE